MDSVHISSWLEDHEISLLALNQEKWPRISTAPEALRTLCLQSGTRRVLCVLVFDFYLLLETREQDWVWDNAGDSGDF